MVKSRNKKIITMLAVVILLLCFACPVLAQNDREYSISAYDVNVWINADGSLDVTESIDFTFYGGFNNIMIPIAKHEGEEIEVQHVYIMRKKGFIECKRLLAGQWDAEVFTGTYSVIDEGEIVKLKLYGSFSKSFGSVVIKYKVNNAIKRYRDVAEYKRMHILKMWEIRISNINLYIFLPENVEKTKIMPHLHGVFVSNRNVQSRRTIVYNVPDTVPGEYVEARILFPEKIVPELAITEDRDYLQDALQEESEYQKSDKEDLLRARENAARKAEQKAYNDRLRRRARTSFTVISILLSAAGLYLIFFIQRRIRKHKKTPLPASFQAIERLDPSEVRMLMANGRTGAKALLADLLKLASMGYIVLELKCESKGKPRFIFRLVDSVDLEALNPADRYLMGWVAGMACENRTFDPKMLIENTKSELKARSLKELFDQWDGKVKAIYHQKNMLDIGIVKFRNLGIVSGVLLVFSGFVIPITLAIAAGFLMIPVGIILLFYSLRIRKHTDFGVYQHRIWMAIKHRIKKNNVALDMLPDWMKPYEAFLGYAIVLGIEKEIIQIITNLTKLHPQDCGCFICPILKVIESTAEDLTLHKVLKHTLNLFDEVFSSVQDAV